MNLQKMLQEPTATVVDVRERWEFSMGKAEGSINIPLGEVMGRIGELEAMSKPLILICQSGNRSGIAAAILHGKGVREVYNGGSWMDVKALQSRLTTTKA